MKDSLLSSRFSDSETNVRLDHGVSGCDVFLFQALHNPGVDNSIDGNYPRPEEAVVSEVIGNVSGKKVALVLDDMISSGGTVRAVVDKLEAADSIQEVRIAVSHNLCLPVYSAGFIVRRRPLARVSSGPLPRAALRPAGVVPLSSGCNLIGKRMSAA